MEKIAALEEAIEKKSLVGIYSVFYTIAHGDPNFSTNKFKETLAYVKTKNIQGLMQEYDGEEFETEDKWNEGYWALIASSLMDNFCEERIAHLEAVGKKVYKMTRRIESSEGKSKNVNNLDFNTGKENKFRIKNGKTISTNEERERYKVEKSNKAEKKPGILARLFGGNQGKGK
jgi:hypothetical protein